MPPARLRRAFADVTGRRVSRGRTRLRTSTGAVVAAEHVSVATTIAGMPAIVMLVTSQRVVDERGSGREAAQRRDAAAPARS
jgi:hypothetical protein